MLNALLPFLALSGSVSAAPLQVVERNNDIKSYYDLYVSLFDYEFELIGFRWDLQAHRGGRGEYVESLVPFSPRSSMFPYPEETVSQ